MMEKLLLRKVKVGRGFHVSSGVSCHKTDARRKRNIYHTSGAKHRERSAGKTMTLVTGHAVITMLALEASSPTMGSCVRFDLNHLSMHEHSRRRCGESFEEK